MKTFDKMSLVGSNAVLYARVSSKEQEQEGFSIPAQLKLLKDYAAKEGFEVIHEFVDVETAKQAGRANFTEMVKFFQNGSCAKALLVEKTDRLYRNFRDYVTIDDLIHNGLAIHFVKEGEVLSKDSRSHQKLIHGIKVVLAKNYIDNLSEETRKGLQEKAEQGFFPSVAPLGYNNNPQTKLIEIDLERAAIIRKIFQLYATGNCSFKQIKEIAMKEGLKSRYGRAIYKSTIEAILKNPIYFGAFLWNGKLHQGKHDPIISKALFDTVQQIRSGHQKFRGIGLPRKGFAFTGLLRCGKCGCSITAELKKKKHIYYHCTHAKGKCGQPYVKEDQLAQLFAETVKQIQIPGDRLEWLKEALKVSHQDEKAYHDGQIERLTNQYKTLQRRLDQMYVDKLDGKVLEDFYREKSEAWRREQEEIRQALGRHEKANRSYFDEGVKLLELANSAYSLYVRQTPLENRRLIQFVLSNAVLDDVTLYPTYRKPFCWLVDANQNKNWLPLPDLFRTFFCSPEVEPMVNQAAELAVA